MSPVPSVSNSITVRLELPARVEEGHAHVVVAVGVAEADVDDEGGLRPGHHAIAFASISGCAFM